MKASDKDLNRKAFPKFLLWVGGGALVGFCAGIASGILGDLNAGAWASVRLPALLGTIAPWGIPVSSVILLGICLAQYRSAKTLCDRWDGEDETAPDAVDRKLNVVLLCSSLAMILDFLFLGMGVLYTEGGHRRHHHRGGDAGLRGPGGPGPAEDRGPDPADEPGEAGQRLRPEVPGEVV